MLGAGVGRDFVHQGQSIALPDFLDIAVVLDDQYSRVLHDVIERGRGDAVAAVDVKHFQMVRAVPALKVVDKLLYRAAMLRVRPVKDKDFHALSV